MSEVILGVAVAAVIVAVVLIVHARARRSAPATDGTTDPVARPDRAPPSGSREHAALSAPNVWRVAIVSDLSAAEELLDAVEGEGYQERELIVLGDSTFLVRWRRDRAASEGRGAP
ncbi:MAG: hypothetical protein J0I06_20050 [Planctomycetes bacterium]|nr:hypothetical protein [Planctomycetota bacterium]